MINDNYTYKSLHNERVKIDVQSENVKNRIAKHRGCTTLSKLMYWPFGRVTSTYEETGKAVKIELEATNESIMISKDDIRIAMPNEGTIKIDKEEVDKKIQNMTFPPSISIYYDSRRNDGKIDMCIGLCRVPGSDDKFLMAKAMLRKANMNIRESVGELAYNLGKTPDELKTLMKQLQLKIVSGADTFTKKRAREIVTGRINRAILSRYATNCKQSLSKGLIVLLYKKDLSDFQKKVLRIKE